MKRKLDVKLSGNEIYYPDSLILLVKNMLCSKLRCQKGFNSIPFSCKTMCEASSVQSSASSVP
jgi:hypothetical protein